MNVKSLFFTGPGCLEIRADRLAGPGPGQVLVKTRFTSISSGSELVVYRGLAPDSLPVDESIAALDGHFTFPMKYGYSAVGEVISTGKEVPPEWKGRRVFSFQPHATFFPAGLSEVLTLPPGIADEDALFLPAMETAVNLVMDGSPVIGERTAVFGQGTIGLLTTALLAMHPLSSLTTFDRLASRRQMSVELGADRSFDPEEEEPDGNAGFDLVFELSGNPDALNRAVARTGFAGRIVIGSWYGKKPVTLDLGARFHRDRIRLISSQVSTIDPLLQGRWDKNRRFALAWELIRVLKPSRLISQRIPFKQALTAYELLDRHPEECLQVIFTYS